MGGGIEAVGEAVRLHLTEPSLCVAGVTILQMLASLNDITRDSILKTEVLLLLLGAQTPVHANSGAATIHAAPNGAAVPPAGTPPASGDESSDKAAALAEHLVGLAAQLARGGAETRAVLAQQASPSVLLRLCGRFPLSASLHTNAARTLAAVVTDTTAALEFVQGEGLAQMQATVEAATGGGGAGGPASGLDDAVGGAADTAGEELSHEVQVLCESVALVLARHLGKPPPEDVDEYEGEGVAGMAALLRQLVAESQGRDDTRAQEARAEARAAEEARAAKALAVARLEAAHQGGNSAEEPSLYSTAFNALSAEDASQAGCAEGTASGAAPTPASASPVAAGGQASTTSIPAAAPSGSPSATESAAGADEQEEARIVDVTDVDELD